MSSERALRVSLGGGVFVRVSLGAIYNGTRDSMEVKESGVNFAKWRLHTTEVACRSHFDESASVCQVEQKITLRDPGRWSVFTDFALDCPDAKLHIPTVMYRDNDKGKGTFPTGGFECGWYFCEDRMPIPGCVQVYSKTRCVTMFMNPLGEPDRLVSIRATEGHVTAQFPSNESPISYSGKIRNPRVEHAEGERCVDVEMDPVEVTRVFSFMVCENCQGLSDHHFALAAYERAVEYVMGIWHEETTNAEFVTWGEYFAQKMKHLEFLTEHTSEGSYVKMGKNNLPELQTYYEFTGASFLIKSLEAAVIYAKTGELDIAEAIGKYFLQAERAPGVFMENHSLTTGEWGGYLGVGEDDSLKFLVNSRCVGEALLHYVELYEILEKNGKNVPAFINLAKRVAQFFVKAQLPNGCYGRWFTPDGESVNAMGTNGAHIIPFLLRLAPHLEDRKFVDNSIKAASEYYRNLIDEADFYGDTLDADAYDKESAVILMRACLDLFESTGNDVWVASAVKCARFALTWIWQYNVAFPKDTPLHKARFLTIGMTNVSVAHHHLDFYGMTMGYDFFRLAEHTGNRLYNMIGARLINACRQMVSNERHPYNMPPEMIGWQPEQMDYTDWDYFHVFPASKGQFNVCVAWLTVLGLNAYLCIKDRYPDMVTP